MKSAKEKRITPRFGPVVMKTQLSIRGELYEGYVINLSRGGGFLAMDEPPDAETEITIHTLLPFKLGSFHGEARVVWRTDPAEDTEDHAGVTGIGFRFSGMDERSNERLVSYLSRFEALASQIDELPVLHDA